jgi:hypothetical protein
MWDKLIICRMICQLFNDPKSCFFFTFSLDQLSSKACSLSGVPPLQWKYASSIRTTAPGFGDGVHVRQE